MKVRAFTSFKMLQVLDQGKLVEYEVPYVLLQNSESLFSKYVQQTGSENTRALFEIAEEAYINRLKI